MKYQKELTKRNLSFGLNSVFLTLVVVALVGTLNFLVAQYPKKFDLTKNKLHTFSDQTEKVMKGLKSELKAEFYGDLGLKEKNRPLFDNYRKLSNQFKFELVDPNREPTRAKQSGVKKMETLVLSYQGKTTKIEELTEEKITNEIIKLTRDKTTTICSVVGHGEPSFTDSQAAGFSNAKKGLEDQSYAVKEIVLPQETSIPADCSVVVMMGATKALFPAEIKMLSNYLDQGGRLLIGFEATITPLDQTKELRELMQTWGIEVKTGLVIDPVSRMLGVDASVPIIAQFNNAEAITKDSKQQCYFPFTRPVDLVSPVPEGIKTSWLAKTTPKAWGETNMGSIAKGEVEFNAGNDFQGPVTTGVIASGKKKSAPQNQPENQPETRIVAYGSAQFASNQYSRFGGNQDLFLNSVSWLSEDESLISIRAKEDDIGKIELSQNQGIAIFIICFLAVPLIIAVAGIVIWVRRKKL